MAGRPSFRDARPFGRHALVALLLLGGANDALAGRQFYVDFAGGNDAADGQSPATAWQRAPGDPQASGNPRALRLAPGDRVLFRGGVRYRGRITIARSGTAEAPIVYDGSGWGAKRAVIDGSQPVGQPVRCPSQAACLGSPHWRNLMMVPIPADTRWSDWLFVGDQAMQMAQWPSVNGFWEYDDADKMAAIPLARLPELEQGFIAVPGVPETLMAGSPTLGNWHNSNDIYPALSFSIQPDGIRFNNPIYLPYRNRDNRFVIYNTPSEVNAPGKFALSGRDGVAIFWPQAAATPQRLGSPSASVGTRRPGFEFNGVSHVRIRGFSFANFSSPQFNDSTTEGSGVPIRAGVAVRNVEISDNAFRSIVNMTRAGAIRMIRGSEIDIARNQFDMLPWASAIYVSHTEGPVRVRCNTIRNVGRNGVRILSARHVEIEGNLMDGLHGIHGAGINLYLDNRYAMVRGNVIRNASFPLTMHGTTTPFFTTTEPVNLNLVDNVMISTDSRAAAISSWGRNLHNVTMTDNFLGSERIAIRFSRDERNIVYARNRLVGTIALPRSTQLIDGGGNVQMAVDGNGEVALAEAAREAPDQSLCGGSGGSSGPALMTSASSRGL